MDYDRPPVLAWTLDGGSRGSRPQRVVTLLTSLTPASSITRHTPRSTEQHKYPAQHYHLHNEFSEEKKIDTECLKWELCVKEKSRHYFRKLQNNCKRWILMHCQEWRVSDKSIFVRRAERERERRAGGRGCQHLVSDLEWQIWTYLDRAEMICRFGSRPQHSHSKWTQSGWRR